MSLADAVVPALSLAMKCFGASLGSVCYSLDLGPLLYPLTRSGLALRALLVRYLQHSPWAISLAVLSLPRFERHQGNLLWFPNAAGPNKFRVAQSPGL